ncbi:hypothetical protein ES703_102417 [subsurface metagenome]
MEQQQQRQGEEPQIIKQLDPHEIETQIKAQKEAEAARALLGLAAQPVKEVDTMPGLGEIPQVIKQLDPHEIETLIKARKSEEAAKETLRLAAQPVREYDPMPGPEAIPTVFDMDAGKYVPYLSLFPGQPEHKWGPAEFPLSFKMGDPRASIESPHRMIVPKGDAELPPGYPGRITPSPAGQYAVSSTGPLEVTHISEKLTL